MVDIRTIRCYPIAQKEHGCVIAAARLGYATDSDLARTAEEQDRELPRAEQIVWQQIEAELLQHSLVEGR